jgi:hypothetical protein
MGATKNGYRLVSRSGRAVWLRAGVEYADAVSSFQKLVDRVEQWDDPGIQLN